MQYVFAFLMLTGLALLLVAARRAHKTMPKLSEEDKAELQAW